MAPEEITKNILETIIDSFREATLIVNKDGTVLFANETFAKRVERKLDEIIDKSFYEFFPPDVAERRKSYLEQVIKEKKTATFEDERSGRYFLAYMTPMLDAFGNVDKVLVIAHDITEKKRLENELMNVKEQLTSILNSIDEKIYIADLKTYELLFTNIYTKSIFGNDIDGRLCYEVLHKFDKPCEFCPNEMLQKLKGEPYRLERYNPIAGRYYIMTNKIIKWTDGRDVKLCIGTDITDKKMAESRLIESEKRHREIIENLAEGFFRVTLDGRYLMANKALARLYGYSTPEELTVDKKNTVEQRFVNKKDHIYLVKQIEEKGFVENFESLRVRKDGSTFWALTNVRAVKDDSGKTMYHEGTTVDITERKLLDDALKAEKEKLQTIVENAPFGMALIDADGKYLYVNPTFKRLFGYDLADIPDRDTWFKKAYPDREYRNTAMALWNYELEQFKKGESISRVLTITCKDGSNKVVDITPVVLPTGQYIMAFIDITEKQRLEANYRSIFENAAEGIAQTTLDGKTFIANPAFLKILGYDSHDDALINIRDITTQVYVNPRDRERVIEIIKSGKEVERFETQFYRKDGTKIWVSMNISAVYDEKGEILHLLSVVEDITDKKKKEEELESLRQQYSHAQRMEALGTLTGGIAHDFNNFLTAIMGYANLAQIQIKRDTHLKKYIDQILSVSNKMADLVKNLLAFSRKQPVNLMPLDLNNEVKETKKLIKRLLTENIELKVITSDKNLVVMADKTQLSQILFNMATNARDAMPDGGTLTVKIETSKIDEEFIKTHGFGKKGDYAVISVSDTGIGMEKEIMDKIFDPFFTTKETGKGTGLGLASVYGIVKQHNGYIDVDSSPGKGATFIIYLPLIDITAKEEIKEQIAITQGTGTILVGEDEEDIRALLKEVLENYGYRVILAEDGERLIETFKEKKDIDLVIADVIMPKKGGIEAYNEIKAIRENTRFILISGYDRDMFSKLPTEDKTVKFVLKPLSVETLLKAVEEMIKK